CWRDASREAFDERIDMTRRLGALVAAAVLGPILTSPRSTAQTATPKESTGSTSIRPFRLHASETELTDLRRRVKATRWPDQEAANDQSQGVPLATMQKLAHYWGTDHDWPRFEAKLNSYPQFTTRIDDVDIHFTHVKSKEKNALPIIITHGWPG